MIPPKRFSFSSRPFDHKYSEDERVWIEIKNSYCGPGKIVKLLDDEYSIYRYLVLLGAAITIVGDEDDNPQNMERKILFLNITEKDIRYSIDELDDPNAK